MAESGEPSARRGTQADTAARVAELEAIIVELRADARRHAEEKRALASENLNLLHRARAAEDRLAARETASAHGKQGTLARSGAANVTSPE